LHSYKILLGVTGSIGAYKACYLLRRLRERGAEVKVAMTESGARLVGPSTFHALSGHPVITDLWDLEKTSSGEIHIELTDWADAVVVYPCTADFLASVATGHAGDPLELAAMASRGPVLLVPAMHHRMWSSPATQANVQLLRSRGFTVIEPEIGPLADGSVGPGRLPEPETAMEAVWTALSPQDLAGRTVLVSAGPTREPLDAVRYLSNPSSGRMGFAIARVARRRGARVVLVHGPVALPSLPGVQAVAVTTAAEMKAAIDAHFEEADAVVMAAAVSDFRPAAAVAGKVAKGEAPESLELARTEDILAGLGGRKGTRVLIGFAMETGDLEARAGAKLRAKNLDLIVGNDLTAPGAGFEHDTNDVLILAPDADPERVPLQSKEAVASRLLDRLVPLLEGSR